MGPWNTPFNFGGATGAGFGIPANTFTGAAGAASAAGGAAATGGAAAAGGLPALGAFGGPVGLGFMAGAQVLGAYGANQAAQASLNAAKEQQKLGYVANLAGQKYLMDQMAAREKQSLLDKQLARSAGFTRPDDFAALLSSGRMGTSEAARMATSPLFRA